MHQSYLNVETGLACVVHKCNFFENGKVFSCQQHYFTCTSMDQTFKRFFVSAANIGYLAETNAVLQNGSRCALVTGSFVQPTYVTAVSIIGTTE